MIVLPAYTVDEAPPPHPSKEVTKVALRLKYQIEQLVPCEIGNDELSNPNSRIITKDVVHTATQAGVMNSGVAWSLHCCFACDGSRSKLR